MNNLDFKRVRHTRPLPDGIEDFSFAESSIYVILNPNWNARLSTEEGRAAFRNWIMGQFSCCVAASIKKGLESNRYYFQITEC